VRVVAHDLQHYGEVTDFGLVHFDHERLDVYTECAAVLDVTTRLEIATAASCQPARELLLRIVSMLINMGRALHA
jgi:hypothetical protein